MATAGSIVISLLAATGSFETDMQRASRRVKSTTSDFDKAAEAAKKFGMVAGTAALAFVSATAAIVMNAAKAMDATSKMAQQIGVTTEALTGMRFAAQQFANISDQQFDMSMRRMTRRIEEAAAGSGAAKSALEEMGLSAKALSQMTPDRQMLALADAMKRTESQANRLRYTMAIFDTEGMALVPALQQGSKALEEQIKLAERYGVVLSTEAAQAAEAFSTNLSHLSSMLDGLKIRLASEVLPTINQFVANVIQATTEVDGLHTEVNNLANDGSFKSWFESALVGLARVADVAVVLSRLVYAVGGSFQVVGADIEAFAATTLRNIENLNPASIFDSTRYQQLLEEEQRVLENRSRILEDAAQRWSDVWNLPGNQFEQAALSAINTIRLTSDEVKLVDLTVQNATKAIGNKTKKLTEAQKAAEAFRKEQERSLIAQYQSISAIHQQAQAIEDQVALFGLSKTAIEDLTIARLEEEAVVLRMYGERSADAVEAIEREIEARKRLRTAMGSLEQKEAERASWQAWAQDVEQVFQQVGQSLTDAIFDGGKSGLDLLKDWAKTLTLRIFVQPVMSSLQGMVTNQLGGLFGVQNPQQGGGILGMAQNANTLYQAYSGGMASNLGQGIQWIGNKIGSQALQSFATGLTGAAGAAGTVAGITSVGAGLGASLGASIGTSTAAMASTSFSAALSGGAGASMAATAGASGFAGAGAALGAALPWVGGALAIGSLLGGGLFDREPTTRHGQRARADYLDGVYAATSADDRQSGAEIAIRQMTQQAVDSANTLFRQAGIDAAIDTFYAITESSIKGDRQGVASGGTVRIGDRTAQIGIPESSDMTILGYGGWSSAEMLPRLATDIQITIMEAFQQASGELPSVLAEMINVPIRELDEGALQDLVARFTSLTQGASAFLEAIETMPFEHLRDLSFDAAAGLVQAAGGFDALTGKLGSYYENFYTEAEQTAHVWDGITKAMTDLGLAVPQTREAFRQLVDSQDRTTEAGQKTYLALLDVSTAFASVTQSTDDLIEAQRKLADEQAALAQRARSADRAAVIAARRAIEEAERLAHEEALKTYADGQAAFDELRQSLLSAGDAAALLGTVVNRALSNPSGKYTAGGVEYDAPRWEEGSTAASFNYAYGIMQMRIARDLSDEVSANALRIENAGLALQDLAPNIGEYSTVVGPLAQALTAAVVEASGDMGYAVRDSVYQAMLGTAQRQVFDEFASQGPGLASIGYAQQMAAFASQTTYVPGHGVQYGADVGEYGQALDRLTGRMKSGQITTDQFDAAVEALNKAMPTAAELLGDTEAQLARMAGAAQAVAEAGARSIDHYFDSLRQMAVELEATTEPINQATAAIGRMNSWVSAFGISAQAAGDYSARTGDAALVAQAAGIAASVLTTRDAQVAAEKLAQDAAFAGAEGSALRDMALLVDGIRAFDPDSWERAFIRISDALGTGAIDQDQYAALVNYSLDVFEDIEARNRQVTDSFNRLKDAAKSLADELLLDRDLSTLSFGQQYAEAQRQYEEVMRRAMGGDADAAGDLDRVTRAYLERSADQRDEIAYRRDFARSVNMLRQVEQRNPVVDEIKRLNGEVEGLRKDLQVANAQIASNTGSTERLLRKIDAMGIKVTA